MPMAHLTLRWLEHVDHTLREAAMRGDFRVAYLCQALHDVGFDKFRYFEFSRSHLPDCSYYVLRFSGPDIPNIKPLKTLLPAAEVNHQQPEFSIKPRLFYGSDAEQPPALSQFQNDIGASGMPSIFVPIHAGNDLVAKLCISWKGNIEDLVEEDIASLIILSRLCGRYIRLAQDVQIARSAIKIDSITFGSEVDGYVDAHGQFLEIVNDLCPSYISAMFEHNWSNDSVSKLHERAAPQLALDHFDELYFRGEHLTGYALRYGKPFLVTHLNEVSKQTSPRLSEESLRRHNSLIDAGLSVIYSEFESGHRDFLIRLSSRCNGISPFFSDLDLEVVNRLCRRFGYKSNDFANRRNLKIINDLFKTSISDFSLYSNVIDQFQDVYSRVFSNPFVLLAVEHNADSIQHVYCKNDNFLGSYIQLPSSVVHKVLERIGTESIAVFARERFNSLLGAECIPENSGNLVFVLPLMDADLKGILFCSVSSKNSDRDIVSSIKPKTKQTLSIISAVIASAISASSSHITTDNAKRLIGHIGHEVEGPIAELSNAAQEGLYRARSTLGKLHGVSDKDRSEMLAAIGSSIDVIEAQSRGISTLMDVAIDMALETENKLEVTYQYFDLSALVKRVSEFVTQEVGRYHPGGVRVVFTFNDRSKDLFRFIGDQILVHKIFVNMFRNAVKYSYPPGPGLPIEIIVNAAVQLNVVDFEIINWGVPIRASDFERIFLPFQRGDAKDPVRARRGMGLGLYIARRFATAHMGTVQCKSSDPTLNDPSRRFKEGHRTKFVVRLGTTLPIATTEVKFNGGKKKRPTR